MTEVAGNESTVTFDDFRRRRFSPTDMLNLGESLLRDQARRMRDVLLYFVVPHATNSRMPSEEMLARQFHTSRNAARGGLQLLAAEQAITRTARTGTYASEPPATWRADRLRLIPTLEFETTLVGWHVEHPIPEPMRERFSPHADRLAIFEKLQVYRGVPGLLRTFFLPLRPGDEFEKEDNSLDLLSILENRFGHGRVRAERIINAIVADESSAELLDVAVGAPLLYIQTAVYAPDDTLILLYFLRQRGEVVQLSGEPERAL